MLFTIAGAVYADFEPPTASRTFFDLVLHLLQKVAKYALPLVGVAIVWAGFRIVSAQGNEEQLREAKRMLYWSIIGTAIVVGAGVIALAVINFANELSSV
ncbi:MAG: hypothetical protein A3C80_02565 [Candidatus Ryanbacteria bacterium RIFCSPHIGHO2_02_FULL_45_43]|uniref:TrbC/VIRB2 family protein n=1 Tax=Candidatus Ryanbacteria bacterium RIFCSPHIGHO2_01_45_13 TaxID=1802112 RepID=A0A1G2FWM9_9BACT|nr:MAG: hypothetical protein A2718_00995 [Candidatus Ryanbacteria bacterium RIFCSPHIGHO2_01_FULL_44_130]OGZ42485.1 MAG: hypothetical protein A2W41_03840 [Candidatus Ryanbacteria bacterium RIFCSPHIGHO2_01_45_13]OGZ48502.1 MAG: hypothetical protein A3C80_02565 [Candidatus Ryanbacteria bacterium RIFCSPHIGHO2_02_FULL_45_43]OGZ50365.1 MAG: hypothetical protein A3E55_00460 [Candidatus Ryanbacteria bacterium RIFCSPHIGHO2_12_FULL_44_20]OGZ51706.1 MAG: hypothetical protein A3A17_02915 [Candidatus Ryanba